MKSNLPASLFTTQETQSSSSGSYPIRGAPSFDEENENDDVVGTYSKNFQNGGDNSSEAESFHSGEDEFETASERPFLKNPDENTLEVAEETNPFGRSIRKPFPFVETEAGFSQRKTPMPIFQLSEEDDDEGNERLKSDVDDDGFSGVVNIPLGDSSSKMFENPGIRVSDGEEKDVNLGGNDGNESGVSVSEEKNSSLEKGVVENSVERVADAPVGSLEVGSGETLGENKKEDKKIPNERQEAESIEDKGFPEEKTVVLGDNSKRAANENSTVKEESVVETEPGISVVGESWESGVSETLLVEENVVEESVTVGGGSEEVIPVIEELVDSKFVETVADAVEESKIIDNGSSDRNIEPVDGAISNLAESEIQDSKSRRVQTENSDVLTTEPSAYQSSQMMGEHSAVKAEESDLGSVGRFEKNGPSKNQVLEEPPIETSDASVDNPNQASTAGDEMVGLKFIVADTGVDDRNEAVGNDSSDRNVETPEGEFVEPKTGGAEVQKDGNADGGSASVDAMQDGSADKLDVTDVDENISLAEAKQISNAEVESQPVLEGVKYFESYREMLRAAGIVLIGDGHVSSENRLNDGLSGDSSSPKPAISAEEKKEAEQSHVADVIENMELKDAEDEDSDSEEHNIGLTFGGSEAAEQIMKEMERGSTSSQSGFGSLQDNSQKIDGQIFSDSDEEVATDEEGDGKELFDSAALAALLKAAGSADSNGIIPISSPDAGRFFSVDRPAGLGSSIPSLRPASRLNRPNITSPSDAGVVGEPENNLDEEGKKLQEKIHQIRVKFLRLVHRTGHSPEDTIAAQVLYRLNLAEGIRRGMQISRAFNLETAKKKALELEAAGKDDLDFSINVLILGKSGVGKSATINSIFGEEKTSISAFRPATIRVKEITGTVDGVKIRVIDTPGLKHSIMDQTSNRKILSSVKKFMERCPPDIVLYIDRLDTQTRDFNDLPVLKSITSTLGSSIWLNAIVALTHAASAPPDGPNGSPLSYEVFVAQRSHIVQHSIRQAAADMRLMNSMALVENHPSCRRNREGQRVLPNGQSWRPQLLLLCYSLKISTEANSLLKLQDSSAGKFFGFRVRSPPLPFLLSSLLQSRAHPKLSTDLGGENDDSDIDLADLSDSDQEEEEDEYDQLPPFKPLRKAQIDKLSKEQRKAYFDEFDYRVKLLQKKQWKEELTRLKEMKKRGKEGLDDYAHGDMGENFDQENGSPAAIPVPLPDMVLPPSFDGDNPAYRYRFLEPTSQLLARPVLDTHGWDHDCGYDGVSLEETLAIASRFPASVAVQITKDKKEFNIHLDSSVSTKHGENGSSLAGFDIQTVGKQLAYILRGETKFKNFKKNKTVAGASVTFLGENVATGLKLEDHISIGKRVSLVASTGAIRAQGDVAYGANLETCLREKDFPIGQDQSTLGLSLMRWRGDLALGANMQSQFSIGHNSKMAVRVGLNNKLSGQVTVRTSSSEQLQIALVGLIPIAASIFRKIYPEESYFAH